MGDAASIPITTEVRRWATAGGLSEARPEHGQFFARRFRRGLTSFQDQETRKPRTRQTSEFSFSRTLQASYGMHLSGVRTANLQRQHSLESNLLHDPRGRPKFARFCSSAKLAPFPSCRYSACLEPEVQRMTPNFNPPHDNADSCEESRSRSKAVPMEDEAPACVVVVRIFVEAALSFVVRG